MSKTEDVLFNRSSVLNKKIMDRIDQISDVDKEMMLTLVIFFLEELEISNNHEIKVIHIVDLIDERLAAIEKNRKE